MAFEQPQSRNEAILQNMLGAENELVPPQSRIEALLQAILLQGVPDGAVTTDKLADGAVTYDKLAEALKNLIDGKENKKTLTTILNATTTEDAVFQLDDTSAGVDLNSYSEIEVIIELPSKVTAFLHNFWKYNDAYKIRVLGSFSSMEMQYIVVKVKKEYGIWWIENTLGIQYDRLATHWKQVYRQGTSNFVFESFEGMRFALSTTNVIPTGTKIQVRGYK